ncbi:MAG TPA: hypothetical protein VM577_14845 [Anaerovoracaceae bacterium]|nr:hypothetical protein [Anaerovoracaceae bacterium]
MILHRTYMPGAAAILEQLLYEPLFWEQGRQATGYLKANLKQDLPCVKFVADKLSEVIGNEIESFDSYLLHYPEGTYIPSHTDDIVFGRKHVRANATLRQPLTGGCLHIGTPGFPVHLSVGDIFIFEPNAMEHYVTMCDQDRYVLSVGTII